MLVPHVLFQMPIAVHLPVVDDPAETTPQQRLITCLAAILALLSNPSDLLKRLNLDLIMHTRSEDVRVQILALTCVRELWHSDGAKLIGFVGETAGFIAECAENESDVVAKARALRDAVEREY